MGGRKGREIEGSRCRRRKERGVLMWAVGNFVLFLDFLLHFRVTNGMGNWRLGRGVFFTDTIWDGSYALFI